MYELRLVSARELLYTGKGSNCLWKGTFAEEPRVQKRDRTALGHCCRLRRGARGGGGGGNGRGEE